MDDRDAADGAVEHEPRDGLWMGDRKGQRDRGAAGHAEEREPLEAGGLHDRLEVAETRLEAEVVDVPIGHAEAALVVADDRGDRPERLEEVAPDRALPVVLEMAQPTRGDDQRRAGPVDGVGERVPSRDRQKRISWSEPWDAIGVGALATISPRWYAGRCHSRARASVGPAATER